MKKIISIVLIMLLFIVLTQNVYAVKPTNEFYINDYANILSDSTESYVLTNSSKLAQATTAQIVVVTVPNLEGRSLEEYSTALFRDFGIGDKEKNNGLLILLALEERQCRVEVGYGLEGLLPDGKTGRFQDEYMIPYFKNNNFDEGILNGYKAFYEEIAKYYNYETEVAPEQTSYVSASNDEEWDAESTFGLLLVIKMVIVVILFFRNVQAKLKTFIVLEILTAIITIGSFMSGGGAGALFILLFGTLINLGAIFICFGGGNFFGGGFYGGGGWSSGGGGFSGGGFSGRRWILWRRRFVRRRRLFKRILAIKSLKISKNTCNYQ